ncbi:MAG TPA: L,D-transpeptidase family protein [Wenzhouxiangellaceae bacterium]|nr:L,D-transpeptidase family protein [Wenzhouxiangellaceae bacterium]
MSEPVANAAVVTANPSPEYPRFPSSETSKSAWINQGDWLSDRLYGQGLRIGDPVHIRIFKKSRELELYLRGRDGFELYRTFPICDVSGMLGPKRFEGDFQAPEGFYTVVPERLHPHSDFHLAFNLGYPNAFDRSMGRTGSNIMIHGGCASNGCFAMTDYYMEQIYLLAEAALQNGQQEIGVEIYPFRMTEDNLAAHASSRWIEFWRSLQPAHDHFANSGLPAPVEPGSEGYRVRVGQPAAGLESVVLSAP